MFSYRFGAIIAVVTLLMASGAEARSLEVPGTGSCETVLNELANAFNKANPSDKIIVPPSIGSTGGIKTVIEGQAKIARVGRRPKGEEASHNLQYIPFAHDAVVFGIGEKAGVRSLTAGQLADIFSGRLTNWQQVGGPRGHIHLLDREPGESSRKIIVENLEEFKGIGIAGSAKILYHDYEVHELLKKYRRSIGFGTRSGIKANGIAILALNGVEPSPENVLEGKYPMSIEHGFVLPKGEPDGLVSTFLDFVFSPQGRSVLEGAGLVPLSIGR